MRPLWKDVVLAAILGVVLPGLVIGFGVAIRDGMAEQPEQPPPEGMHTVSSYEPVTMYLRQGEEKIPMELETYLVGVVCGEMPASFETEALKAQAVVARTYTLKAMTTGGKHRDGSLCQDPACCQAYIAESDYLALGRTQADLEKIQSAVRDTACLVLTYEGSLIEATYFSCSGGSTEDAVAVWGTDYPYLRAKKSPGEEQATYFQDKVFFTRNTLEQALGVSLNADPTAWIGYTTYTAGGGVNTMVIGGKEFRGTQLRSLLGLRSTAFTVEVQGEGIDIVTKGYGHRVGMSQYGADAMASNGADFHQILAYYYTGTELISWAEN